MVLPVVHLGRYLAGFAGIRLIQTPFSNSIPYLFPPRHQGLVKDAPSWLVQIV